MKVKHLWGRSAVASLMIVSWFEFGSAHADEKPTSVEAITAEVILVRDAAVKKLNEAIKPAEENVASKEVYDKVKAELVKKWSETFGAGIKAIDGLLKEKRLAIGNKIEGPEERTVSIQKALRGEFQQRLEDLVAAVGEDAVKKSLDGFDAANATHEDAAKKQEALADAGLAALGETKWAAVMLEIAQASDTVSQQLEAARREVRKLRDDAETKERADFNKTDGFARTVTCDFGTIDDKGRMSCTPGLLVNAADIAEINVIGLPADKKVTVLASSSSESLRGPGSALFGAPGSGGCPAIDNAKTSLACDELTLEKGKGGALTVSVYMNRTFRPRYGGFFGRSKSAIARLRPERLAIGDMSKVDRAKLIDSMEVVAVGWRPQLSLLVSGSAGQVFLRVRVENDDAEVALATGFVQLGYERFFVETGGFLGISDLTDQELLTVPADGGKVMVKAFSDGSKYSQESGLFVNFVSRNYPKLGIGLGFSTDSDRPVSVYLGPSYRLQTFGHRGLASVSAGLLMRSVDRFPRLEGMLDTPIAADSPLLLPTREFAVSWYLALNLGFAFGPIAGPSDDGGDD